MRIRSIRQNLLNYAVFVTPGPSVILIILGTTLDGERLYVAAILLATVTLACLGAVAVGPEARIYDDTVVLRNWRKKHAIDILMISHYGLRRFGVRGVLTIFTKDGSSVRAYGVTAVNFCGFDAEVKRSRALAMKLTSPDS